LGAVAGPISAGLLADRIGFRTASLLVLAAQTVGVALLAASPGMPALVVSSLVIGAALPGIVSLVLGRTQELAEPTAAARRAAWTGATIAFAVGQAAAAYGFSFLFAITGTYAPLFALAAGILALALAVDLAAGRLEPKPQAGRPSAPSGGAGNA